MLLKIIDKLFRDGEKNQNIFASFIKKKKLNRNDRSKATMHNDPKMNSFPAWSMQGHANVNVVRGPGCDFAEYLKSYNNKAIEPGTSVCLDKGVIRPAKKGDIPIGIISKNPIILGGEYIEWPKKFLKDEFDNTRLEEYEEEIFVQKTRTVKLDRQKMERKTVEEEIVEDVEKKVKGKIKLVKVKRKVKREIEEPVFEEIETKGLGEGDVHKEIVPVIETVEVEEPVWDKNGEPLMVGTGKFEKKTRPILNPDYDPEKEYIPRSERPEWNIVGFLGQIPLKKGQPTAPTWVKIKDLSKDVELWLVK